MNYEHAFNKLKECTFEEIPVNDFFQMNGDIFLKLNDTICSSCFSIGTLEHVSIPSRNIMVEHLSLKKPSFSLRISYSWGEDEPEQTFGSFESAWKKACQMALKETETVCADHEQEVGMRIEKSEECGLIVLHYTYDNTYCYYHIGQEIKNSENCMFFNESSELLDHLKFWCSGCGDLHYHGERDITEEELPEPLRYAYHHLWSEGAGCLEYITEYDGEYYLAIEYEYDKDEYLQFRGAVQKMNQLLADPAFDGCRMVIGEGTEPDDRSGIYALIPAKTSEEDFNKLEMQVVKALYNE